LNIVGLVPTPMMAFLKRRKTNIKRVEREFPSHPIPPL
jgi:hypothetical protein